MTTRYGYESSANNKPTLLLDFWLTIARGHRPSVKVNADYPKSLGRNERTINLKMSLPLALFETPTISASINVEQPTDTVHIDTAAIAEAVRGVIGMDVQIEVQQPEQLT